MNKTVIASFFAFGLFSNTALAQLFPPVVENVDLGSYLGKWYEVASTKPFFQRDCVCVTANYALQDDGTVSVANTCRKSDPAGELNVIQGTARATRDPAKLNVSFGGFRLPFSNYWIVDLAEDYSYAAVSSAFRTPVWILSRTPELAPETYQGILDRLSAKGFDVGRISPTLQQGCID